MSKRIAVMLMLPLNGLMSTNCQSWLTWCSQNYNFPHDSSLPLLFLISSSFNFPLPLPLSSTLTLLLYFHVYFFRLFLEAHQCVSFCFSCRGLTWLDCFSLCMPSVLKDNVYVRCSGRESSDFTAQGFIQESYWQLVQLQLQVLHKKVWKSILLMVCCIRSSFSEVSLLVSEWCTSSFAFFFF